MIKLEITGVHFNVDPKMQQYVSEKIGPLDRFVREHDRQPMFGHVILTEDQGAAKQRFTAEVNLSLPRGTLLAKESTPNNMFAAIDSTEAKLKRQLQEYKDKRLGYRQQTRAFIRRVKRFGRG